MSITADLEALGRIGGVGTSVTRYAWSPELQAAGEWLVERIVELGLEAEIDAAGNVVGRWNAGSGTAVLVGSHLDTVPNGGRYDGALGVLAGLDALRSLRRAGIAPRRPVWLASFMDEEGSRFRTGMLGSRAFVGDDLGGLDTRAGFDGATLGEAMAALGFEFDRIGEASAVGGVGAYLELHIEQGPRLERAGVDIGVVTAIVGLLSYQVRLTGEANHAGTTPMESRRDALVGAARAVVALRDEARSGGDMTANVGMIKVEPGGFNVIPGVCEFTIDVRSPTLEGFARIQRFVRETLERIAVEEGLDLILEETHRLEPAPMDGALVELVEEAAALEGASSMRLVSGAGHDAMVLARHVPSVMLFVPSRAGVSHSPDEFTAPGACELGARVLTRAVELLAAPAL